MTIKFTTPNGAKITVALNETGLLDVTVNGAPFDRAEITIGYSASPRDVIAGSFNGRAAKIQIPADARDDVANIERARKAIAATNCARCEAEAKANMSISERLTRDMDRADSGN